MRKTTAMLLGNGMHLKVFSEMQGHSTVGLNPDTHSQLLPAMNQQAAAAVEAILAG